MQSQAKTVREYLAVQPADRRESLDAVRSVLLKNLHKDFEEGMIYGMIGYYVPHSIYPAGYHCDPSKPLSYICLGAQKNYLVLHLMCVYGSEKADQEFRAAWKKSGKKLDMGKACVRFKTADDLALDVIADIAGKFKALEWATHCEKKIADYRASKAKTKTAKKSKTAIKKKVAKKK